MADELTDQPIVAQQIVAQLQSQLRQSRQQEAVLEETLTRLLEMLGTQGPG